jgi:hypothetical protein
MSTTCFAIASACATLLAVTPALAGPDDAAWIKRCVSDNSDQNQTEAVISGYCTCMNNKMSANETLSITAWEKRNPVAQEACSKEAGWKGK